MNSKSYHYVFRIQYLGIRYHGWQVQKGVKTVQGTLEKNFRYVLQHEDFNILGSSRTDTGVSCLNGAFELFLPHTVVVDKLILDVNKYLPSDIRILSGCQSPKKFNIIQDVQNKNYGYYFAVGDKPHPMHAGSVTYAGSDLNMSQMKKGASLFEGKHDFRRFCSHGKNTADFVRNIHYSRIEKPPEDHSFLPKKNIWVYRVKGEGFLMHQVRRMTAALFLLGNGAIAIEDLNKALKSDLKEPLSGKAPANGLILENVSFDNDLF